jgi:retron-type reverse transcriptase
MKTARNLFEPMCGFDNLMAAYRSARKGKRASPEVAAFELRCEDHVLAIQRDLVEGRYRFGEYRHFQVREPKERLVAAAPFRDRIVHHAIVGALEPVFDPGFIDQSYACRRGKGTHRAVLRCQRLTRRYPVCLKADVWKFFHTIDHSILVRLINNRVRDEQMLALVDALLATHTSGPEYHRLFAGDDLFSSLRPRGIPIGNLTSQFFANLYLSGIDHFVKRELGAGGYVRYMDDFLLFSDDVDTLRSWRVELARYLASRRLTLHSKKRQIVHVDDGVPFLGFRVQPCRRPLLRSGVRRFVRRTRAQVGRWRAGELEAASLQTSVRGWLAHAAFADGRGLLDSILPDLLGVDGGGRTGFSQSRAAGRLLEQQHHEPAVRGAQQQQPDEPQQQHRFPLREDVARQSPGCRGGSGRA